MSFPAPTFVDFPATRLIGRHTEMSMVDNQTAALWREVSPRLSDIDGRQDTNRISLQVYPQGYFAAFSPTRTFTKWAGVAVAAEQETPEGWASLEIPAGRYAVFHYQGPGNDPAIFQYIYGPWLATSGYRLDDRPHFEVLGADYKPTGPTAQEDIYIPITDA